jgi:hypothetical protein
LGDQRPEMSKLIGGEASAIGRAGASAQLNNA